MRLRISADLRERGVAHSTFQLTSPKGNAHHLGDSPHGGYHLLDVSSSRTSSQSVGPVHAVTTGSLPRYSSTSLVQSIVLSDVSGPGTISTQASRWAEPPHLVTTTLSGWLVEVANCLTLKYVSVFAGTARFG